MHTLDDKPETIHLYVVRDKMPKPSPFAIFIPVLALLVVAALCTLFPYQQPVTRAVIRVPAVPLAVKLFTAQVAIIPTGVKFYPATIARGSLTITNGSVIAQTLPAGFTLMNNRGVSVATDYAVFVPAGSADSYGYATVSAYSLVSGKSGNVPPLAINQVIGSSVYIRNLSAFSGGRDAYSVKVVTAQDRQTALLRAQGILIDKISGLHYPCSEDHIADPHKMIIAWRCQMLTYHIPAFYHVTGVRIVGKNLILSVWFVARPLHIWVK